MKDTASMLRAFRTWAGGNYVYDGLTGRIMTIGPALARENLQEMQTAVEACLYAHNRITRRDFLSIRWQYDYEAYLERIKSHIPTLVLQITNRCNLRCDYCVYSGNYAHMQPHGSEDMSWETVRKSIDFFADRNGGCDSATIDFYGGEALLCLELLQRAVAYAKARIPDKPLKFRITSNGLLLNGRVLQWMQQNPQVHLTVTVNGPYHDLHRKTAAGQGSLESILQKLEGAKQHYGAVWENQIHFLANVTHTSHIEKLGRFYEDRIGKMPDALTYIRDQDGNEAIARMLREEDLASTEEALRQSYCARGGGILETYYENGIRAIHNRLIEPGACAGRIGSCLPFLEKLYVHHDGRFGICESACDKVILGDLDRGIDEEKLRQLYEQTQRLFNGKCGTCWAQRLCTACFKDTLEPDGRVSGEIPDSFCRAIRESILGRLRMYCQIMGTHPERMTQRNEKTEHRAT